MDILNEESTATLFACVIIVLMRVQHATGRERLDEWMDQTVS